MKTTLLALGAALLAGLAPLPTLAADEGVYGPVAPPNSAFVRVFNATAQPELQARIGDKTLDEIPAYGASEFVFLPPGKYTLTAGAASQAVSLQANKFYTAALEGKALRLMDNERYTNRLKALVIVYNLVDGSTLSLKTPDGRPVIENVGPDSSASREVNAVKVNLALYDGAKKITDVKPMNLERGRAFSLFVAGDKDQPVTSWVVN